MVRSRNVFSVPLGGSQIHMDTVRGGGQKEERIRRVEAPSPAQAQKDTHARGNVHPLAWDDRAARQELRESMPEERERCKAAGEAVFLIGSKWPVQRLVEPWR